MLLVVNLDGGSAIATQSAAPVVGLDARLDNRPALERRLALGGQGPGPGGTDAELIGAAYARWGEELPEHLEGDFALALWDPERRLLLCARDPLGVRPLCWALAGRTVVIASEPQQVAGHPTIAAKLDEVALADHLANLCLDSERTIYEGVWRLPPGHVLVAQGRRLNLRAYWRPFAGIGTGPSDPAEAAAGFREVLARSVRNRLGGAAGPVGLMMSGGLDSGSVAILAADLRRQDAALPAVQPFSYQFRSLEACDDSALVQAVARRTGAQVSWLPVEDLPLLADREAFTPHPGWPFMAWESVEREALRRLSSLGGRRLLTGHVGRYSLVPSSLTAYAARLRAGECGVIGEVARMARAAGLPVLRELRRYLVRPLLPAGLLTATRRMRGWDVTALPGWLAPQFVKRTDLERRTWFLERPDEALDLSPHRLRAPVPVGSVGRAVAWLDSLAAGYGIEVSHPFLDRRVLEYLISLPVRLVYRDGRDRVVIRDALAGLLPDEIRLRRDKTFFGPYHSLCLQGPGAAWIGGLLEDPVLARFGFVDADRLRAAWAQCRASGHDAGRLWMTLTAELWLRAHGERLGLSL